MNYGRGCPLPMYGSNKESWVPQENGVGQNPGSWAAAVCGGRFPQGGQGQSSGQAPRRGIVIDEGVVCATEAESWMTTPAGLIGNGIGGRRDSWTTMRHENGNGFVQNDGIWNPVVVRNSYNRGNESGNSAWTPVTPGKPNLQTSNVITTNKPRNAMENEHWEDFVGMCQDLLQNEPLNLNEVAQDHYQNNGNQSRVFSTPNKNLNLNLNLNSTHVPNTSHYLNLNSAHVPNTSHYLNLNSTHVPNTSHHVNLNSTHVPNASHDLNLNSTHVPNTVHNLNPNHGSNKASPSVSCFPSEDPANWDCGLLAAIVRPKKSPISDPFRNRPQNNIVHDLNKTPVLNSFTQVGSMLQNQQSPTFSQKDGFPVPCRPCYDLNSPPRSELDTISSRVTDPVPFAPITPSPQQKDRHENQRIEDGDNHCIVDSASSAVSTTQKEHLVLEEGDELGIDLNKTPNQKTPARRKKHRPKVIREGKPKRTQTPKDPNRVKRKYVRKTPQENGVEKSPTGKRKYVRKKVVDQVEGQQKTQEVKPTEPVVETPAKSCRKKLNFDSEHVTRDETQNKEMQGINLMNNPRDVEQERRINNILERSAMNVAQNNMYAGVTTNQENTITSIQSELNGPSTPMTKAQDRALNVLARNLSMRNRYHQVGPVSTDLEGRELNVQTLNFDARRGVKRQSLERINSCDLNAMDSQYVYPKLFLGGDNRVDHSNDLTRTMDSHKKTKMQNDLSIPRLENNSRGEVRRPVYGNVPPMQLLGSCIKMVNNPSYQVNERHFEMAAATQNLQKHAGSSKMQPIIERAQKSTQCQVNSVTAMVNWNQMPATPPKDYSRALVVTSPATLLDKKRTAIQNSPSQRSNRPDNMSLQPCKDASGVHQIPFTKPKGRPRKQKGGDPIEDITCMLEALCIYEGKEKERNALVPYRGDNAIIPFDLGKIRKPRPKVDIDPETDRLWKLLMGSEGSEAADEMDKDKEKWWEDERRVFRGRADSFIARMHLVQGDRRFSRWKGSVVDSVIGVFLTQNVSDHLSSSAFMSLAAKFNNKTSSTAEIRCQGGACVLVEEPLETILPPTGIIRKQPVFNQRPFVSSGHMRDNWNSISSTNYAANIQSKAPKEWILSQGSLDSSTIHTIDDTRSSSGSNSEAEDQTIRFETRKEHRPANRMRAEKVTMFNELFSQNNGTPPLINRSQYMHHLPKTPIPSQFQLNMTTGLRNVGAQDYRFLGGENISSFPSTKSGMTSGYHSSNVTYQQEVPPQGHQYNFLGGNHPPPAKLDNSVQKQDSIGVSNNLLNGQHKDIPKGRKGISEDEKKKVFDWDSLRRDVLLKCGKKERSQDAKDSLDYEALRRAHVNEISDAIRERGMNNMLADRIKDFLDRLVRDHGSIDLEWLRDVPPDKAKDYLLSIRGLGLKSVECVRLLTLHHLAFPVDTNVGRIAVRLGWVPLQPLPESLQLHLLEMYPVLESIQKYLWPRLCKLDQLTLYELHYQMITFGKVFCTKSKPNCNACPMRAECRHFASAFASARLALPGPEEKRIVPSDAPNSTNATYTTQPVINGPMQLPPAENYCNISAQFSSEPIIEEPTTPEPEPEIAELSLSDIEDQYYDDADEIPTIKLDMNEFTANLQKMQDSLEIQGDMSKALVALTPQAASIPTPKLKNVSRLRTEHLVYELPDSHPILEGLYKREPDDPSPYLLAIWTPGETAHSMQPPERGCQAQESGMLCDRTTCFSCNCIKEANSQVVRGTILMPCRTATRGSFPLNGTYFQVNEMFADHASSLNPIDVPRAWIWNLPRRTVYFGTSVSTIFKGLTTQEIQQCFWRGFVCVRGFDQTTRAPRPLMARLHFPASRLVKTKNEDK